MLFLSYVLLLVRFVYRLVCVVSKLRCFAWYVIIDNHGSGYLGMARHALILFKPKNCSHHNYLPLQAIALKNS